MAAGLVSLMGKDLFDLTQVVLGVFAGPLLACMVLAVSNIRIHGKAMNIGLVAGIVAGVSAVFTPLAVLWISPLSTATTALVAWIATQWTTETKKVA